ncbi:MAG: glycosyl transferase [Eubacterium sp.]|nr:glycosyl transferase [Eubacterium sp.]
MHAIMIIAHNQFELLEKLILALDDERNDIFVHIDAKVSDFDFEYFKTLTKFSEVFFTDERVNVTWGDFSQVKTEITLLKTAYAHNDKTNPYTYYHLISGVDLPIKSNDYIHSFFEDNDGKEFVHYTDNTVSESSLSRLKYYHFFRKKRNSFTKILSQSIYRIEKIIRVDRLKNNGLLVQKGCNWFSITGDFAEHIVKNIDKYENSFKYSYCGDEVFIQTLLESSKYKYNLYMPNCNNDHTACMRLIDWERGNPYVWRKENYDEIMASPCIFARKFDINTDSEIIDMVLDSIK